MGHAKEKVEAVRDAGELALKLLEIDTPPVSFYCETTEGGSPILKQDERYWPAWQQIKDIVEPYGLFSVSNWEEDTESPVKQADATRKIDGEEWAQVHAGYGADGTLVITLEFYVDEGWGTYISERASELTPLDVGRRVAAIELAILANELESPTETLDYWMTTEQYTRSQSRWADIRSASRQTVSDRIRSAREKLGVEDLSN